MIVHQILKVIFILCIASLIMNGLLYFSLEKEQFLYNIYGAIGLGILSGIGIQKFKSK